MGRHKNSYNIMTQQTFRKHIFLCFSGILKRIISKRGLILDMLKTIRSAKNDTDYFKASLQYRLTYPHKSCVIIKIMFFRNLMDNLDIGLEF